MVESFAAHADRAGQGLVLLPGVRRLLERLEARKAARPAPASSVGSVWQQAYKRADTGTQLFLTSRSPIHQERPDVAMHLSPFQVTWAW
jgi:hypothetical protein